MLIGALALRYPYRKQSVLTLLVRAGTRPDEETALPAGATAAQLREWADRMLRRRAADAAQEGAASSSGARAAQGNLPEQAGMSDDLKVRVAQAAMFPAVQRLPILCPTC